MGKHSGRHALGTRLRELGFDLAEEQLNDVFKRFKALADVKKGITDEDISALAGDEAHQPTTIWELQDLQVRCCRAAGPSHFLGTRVKHMHALYGDAHWRLFGRQVVCGTLGLQTATVKMRGPDGISHVSSSIGVGEPATSLGTCGDVGVPRC